MKVVKPMTTWHLVLGSISPSIIRVHNQMILVIVTVYSIHPRTLSIATRDNNATLRITALKLLGGVTTRAPTTHVEVSQIHNQTDMWISTSSVESRKMGQLVPQIWVPRDPLQLGRSRAVSRSRVMFEGPCTDSPPKLVPDTRNIYTQCIAVLQERYGSRRPALIVTLQADLSTVWQEVGESMDTFGDWVYVLTNQAYPDLVNAPTLLQS